MSSAHRRKARLKKERDEKRQRAEIFQQQKATTRQKRRAQHEKVNKRLRANQARMSSLMSLDTEQSRRTNRGPDKDYIKIPAWVILGIIIIAFMGGAYIYKEYWGQTPSPESPESLITTQSPVQMITAPDFVLAYIGDSSQTFRLSDWRGHPVLIEFFTIRCSACASYLPNLKAIATQFGNHIVMVSISVLWGESQNPDTLVDLQHYISEENITWWVVRDTANAVSKNGGETSTTEAYGISSTPTTFLINQTGQKVFKQVGPVSIETLETKILQLF